MSLVMLPYLRRLDIFACVTALFSFVPYSSLVAQDKQAVSTAETKSSDLGIIQQFINPTTIVVAQVDMQRMQLPKAVEEQLSADKNAQPLFKWLSSIHSTFAPMIADERVTVMLDVPFSTAHTPVRIIAKQPATFDLVKLNEALAVFLLGPAVVQGDMIATTAPGRSLLDSNKLRVGDDTLANNDAMVQAAASEVKDLPLQILIVPPAYLRTTYEELMPQLPASWDSLPMATLSDGLQWAALGFDPADMRLQVTIQSKTAAAAERLSAALPRLLELAVEHLPAGDLKVALTSLTLGKPSVNLDRIEWKASNIKLVDTSTKLAVQLLSSILDPLNMRERQTKLKKLALAINNYVSANKTLPPNQASRKADGSSNLSWRVHILPYIDQLQLYSEFKLDESWDSPHNRTLIDKMPDIFASAPSPLISTIIPKGHATFLAPTGEGTIFGGNKPVNYGLIKDGLSNTIFFVEVKPQYAVPWSAPQDYTFPVNNPGDGLAIGPDGQFLAALGDGSVRLLLGNSPKETLLHLFYMNDGQ